MLRLILASSLLLTAFAIPAQTSYSLPAAEATTGTRIRPTAAKGARYPYDKRYDAFTAEERTALKSIWEDMPADDEPPFPADGMKALMLDIHQTAQRLNLRGPLVLHAHVGSDGVVNKVDIYKSPDEKFGKYAAIKLGRTHFKPAKCGGQPCAMEFPLSANMVMSDR